jgi:hypothetical protein
MDISIIDSDIEKYQIAITDDQKKIDLLKQNIRYHERQLKNALNFKKELEGKNSANTQQKEG